MLASMNDDTTFGLRSGLVGPVPVTGAERSRLRGMTCVPVPGASNCGSPRGTGMLIGEVKPEGGTTRLNDPSAAVTPWRPPTSIGTPAAGSPAAVWTTPEIRVAGVTPPATQRPPRND